MYRNFVSYGFLRISQSDQRAWSTSFGASFPFCFAPILVASYKNVIPLLSRHLNQFSIVQCIISTDPQFHTHIFLLLPLQLLFPALILCYYIKCRHFPLLLCLPRPFVAGFTLVFAILTFKFQCGEPSTMHTHREQEHKHRPTTKKGK